MKRLAIRTSAWLLIGALTSLAIAAGAESLPMSDDDVDIQGWSADLPPEEYQPSCSYLLLRIYPNRLRQRHALHWIDPGGWRAPGFVSGEIFDSDPSDFLAQFEPEIVPPDYTPDGSVVKEHLLVQSSAGWPAWCLSGMIVGERPYVASSPNANWSWTVRSALIVGNANPLSPSNAGDVRFIPLRVDWTALAGNATVVGLPLLAIHYLLGMSAALRRYSRGVCPRCKYQRNGDFRRACPECGHPGVRRSAESA